MLKYILMILGGVIFIAGYYFMQQNEGRGKTMMFYLLFTYAGLTLVILSGAKFWIFSLKESERTGRWFSWQ